MTTDEKGELLRLYRDRFPEAALANKDAIWKVICRHFLARFVAPTDTVVDIGAGYCEFINNIEAHEKIAVDLNPDIARFAAPGVRLIAQGCTGISDLPDASANVVFMSNFLEHLREKDQILATFRESLRILRPGGRLLILQPNIRFVGGEYWDYFDHHTPLTDRSLVEALMLAGFAIELCIPRFLPYTTRSALPQAPWLVRLYLAIPLVWRILGKQAFVVARRPTIGTQV